MTNNPTARQPTSFRDRKGREWIVELDFAALQALKDACQVDLGNVERLAETWARLLYDDQLAVSVLWQCVKASAEASGVSRDDFLAAINGEALEAGVIALGASIESFTQPRKRGMATKAMAGVTDAMQAAIAEAEVRIHDAIAHGTSRHNAPELLATSPTAGP